MSSLEKKQFISTTTERIDNLYDIRNDKKAILGKGNFGLVLKAKNKETGVWRAVKVVKKSKLPDPDKFKSEFDILRQLDHPNIIKLFEVFEDKKYIYFIMEVCEGGELFERITEKGAFNEDEAKDAFNQIMKAIQYMHHNKIFC